MFVRRGERACAAVATVSLIIWLGKFGMPATLAFIGLGWIGCMHVCVFINTYNGNW